MIEKLDSDPVIIDSIFFNRDGINEHLRLLMPDSFVEEEGLRINAEHDELLLAEAEKEKLLRIKSILDHPALSDLISEGKITVALIKPNANIGRAGFSDSGIAGQIINEEIKPPLQVVFAVPLWMTPRDAATFYSSVKKQHQSMSDPEGGNVWDRNTGYMQSGAITAMLLYSPDGNAVTEWRRQMGPTRPETDADMTTIRGRFGFDVRHNIVHGSSGDFPMEKKRNVAFESAWIRGKVAQLLWPKREQDFLSENTLREYGILKKSDVFIAVERFIPPQRVRTEGATYSAYIVTFISRRGQIVRKRIAVKDKFRKLLHEAQEETRRIKLFSDLIGRYPSLRKRLRIPRVYSVVDDGVTPGRIVRDYVPDRTPKMDNIVRDPEWNLERRKFALTPLIDAAALFDMNRIPTNNLHKAFIYDGTRYVYIGSDRIQFDAHVEPIRSVDHGLRDVLAAYGNDEQMNKYIRERYMRICVCYEFMQINQASLDASTSDLDASDA